MLVLTNLIPEPIELVETGVQQPPQLLRPLLLHDGHLNADESPSDDPSNHFLFTILPETLSSAQFHGYKPLQYDL